MSHELFWDYENKRHWVQTLEYLRLIGQVVPQWQLDRAVAERDAAWKCYVSSEETV